MVDPASAAAFGGVAILSRGHGNPDCGLEDVATVAEDDDLAVGHKSWLHIYDGIGQHTELQIPNRDI